MGGAGVPKAAGSPGWSQGGPANYHAGAQVTLGVPECELTHLASFCFSAWGLSQAGCGRDHKGARTPRGPLPPSLLLGVCLWALKDPAGMFGATWVWTHEG